MDYTALEEPPGRRRVASRPDRDGGRPVTGTVPLLTPAQRRVVLAWADAVERRDKAAADAARYRDLTHDEIVAGTDEKAREYQQQRAASTAEADGYGTLAVDLWRQLTGGASW